MAKAKNKTLPLTSCLIELATGIAVIASPGLVARALFSAELTPGGEAIGRLGGCGLFALAIACWPRSEEDQTQSIRALFLYNLAAACYLCYLGLSRKFVSLYLLPAAIFHGILAALFVHPVYESATGKTRHPSKNP
jgi:hypothetical protein